jgi:endonuclease YncB( thermonuclease family)
MQRGPLYELTMPARSRGMMRASRRLLWRACIAVALCAASAPALAEPLALDGDDIIINGQDYRLEGVDAFESNQVCRTTAGQAELCGDRAGAALAAILAGKQVTCTPTGKRHRNRLIANCTAAGLDVEAELVRSGWALVRPDFLSPTRAAELCAVEAEAKGRKAGVWAAEFELPYFQKGGRRKSRNEVSCHP